MSHFDFGQTYTRQAIHDRIGGDLQSYLPRHDGRVVAGCFTTESNPTAPALVLVGEDPTVLDAVVQLKEQGGAIPVFMKGHKNAWEYVGVFEVADYNNNPADLLMLQKAAGRDDGLTAALYLREVLA